MGKNTKLFRAAVISLGMINTAAHAETKATGTDIVATVAEAAQNDDSDAKEQALVVTTTAQKRFENLQKVPLAVQVIAPAELDAHGVHHFQDLYKVSPSLVIRAAEKPINANVSIRGVGTMAYSVGVESSTAVTVDGAAVAFIPRVFTDLPDVAQIEVLRGPQSTLYGKAASAGLIKIMTVQPTDDFHVRGNATVTDDGEYGTNVSVTGPLGENLGYVLSAGYSDWSGNVRNLFNGARANGRETFNARAKLRWRATPDLTFTLSGNYLTGKATVGRPFVRFAPDALLRGIAGQDAAAIFPGVTIGPKNQDVSNNFYARTEFSGGGGLLRSELNLGRMNILSLTSYDRYKAPDNQDWDDTSARVPQGSNILTGLFRSRLFTQELRLLSPGDDAFRYALGLYFADAAFDRPHQRGPSYQLANWIGTSGSRQIAAFGQVDWEFVPRLTATAGLRVQNERVRYTFTDFLANAEYAGDASDDAATYRLGLAYQATPDLLFFGNYSTGYKGQTYDLSSGFDRNRANAGPIKPETSRDRELGARMQFLDQRLTFNVTLFDTDYQGLQAQTIENLPDGTARYRLTNVGKFNTRGVELEAAARLARDLTVQGGVTYLDAKYTSFPAAPCYPLQTAAQGCTGTPPRMNLTGMRAPQSPTWKGNWWIDYTPPVTNRLRGVAQASGEYQTSMHFVAGDPQTFQPGFAIFNLRLGVRDRTGWEVTGFVNNLFDQRYYASLVNSAGGFGNRIATQAVLPRDYRRYAGIRFGLNL